MMYRIIMSLVVIACIAVGVLLSYSKETPQSPAKVSPSKSAPTTPGDEGLKGFKIP